MADKCIFDHCLNIGHALYHILTLVEMFSLSIVIENFGIIEI